MRKTIVLNVIILCLFSFTPLIAQGKKIGWLLEAGVGLKSGETRYNSAQVFLTPSYMLNNHFSLGLGAGMIVNHRDNLIKEAKTAINVPVYGSLNYLFPTRGSLHPFFNLKIGYGFLSNKYRAEVVNVMPVDGIMDIENSGGFFISPAVGIAYSINENHMLRLSLSYDLQRTKMTISDNETHTRESDPSIETFSLRLGWFF